MAEPTVKVFVEITVLEINSTVLEAYGRATEDSMQGIAAYIRATSQFAAGIMVPASANLPAGITHIGIWSEEVNATVTRLRQAQR